MCGAPYQVADDGRLDLTLTLTLTLTYQVADDGRRARLGEDGGHEDAIAHGRDEEHLKNTW